MSYNAIARLIKSRNSVDSKFLGELTRTIEKRNIPKKPSQSYKPSSIGGCLRNIYYQLCGAEVDNTSKDYCLIGIGESGTDRHERIQTAISKMKEEGFNCDWLDVEEVIKELKPEGTKVIAKSGMETKCFNDLYNLSFLCDGVVRYNGELYIIEIKTETSFKYSAHEEPFPEHKMQAACYSLALGINKVIFIYENRDTCDKKAYLVNVSDKLIDSVIDKIELCDGFIDEGEVPPKSDIVKHCQYCNYKTQCRKDGEGDEL